LFSIYLTCPMRISIHWLLFLASYSILGPLQSDFTSGFPPPAESRKTLVKISIHSRIYFSDTHMSLNFQKYS
jgi:hypothetical protein